MSFETAAAGSGVVAVLLGLGYALNKCSRRSRCRSHNSCIEVSVDRVEEAVQKAMTERDTDLKALVIQILGEQAEGHEKKPSEEGDDSEGKKEVQI